MNSIQKFCAAAALALAFALPVCAGDISTGPGAAPPTPAPAVAGEIHTPVASTVGRTRGEAAAARSLTQIALAMLRSVLMMF